MAVTLTRTGKTPGQQQFGLDTFTEHYKCDATADVVLIDGSVPAMGSAHPDYASMFVTARYCTETSESASALDLTYMGTLSGELPDPVRSCSRAVQSASSSSNGDPGSALLASPVTVQFYASVTRYEYISTSNVCGGCVPPDLADAPCNPVIISILFGNDISLRTYFGEDFSQLFLCTFFGYLDTDIVESNEIVAGQYWRNVETKSRLFITKPASTSAIDDCPALGACTGVLGDCVITSEAVCTDLGGTYHGDGSSCS